MKYVSISMLSEWAQYTYEEIKASRYVAYNTWGGGKL